MSAERQSPWALRYNNVDLFSNVAASLLLATVVSTSERRAKYESVENCTSDAPQSLVTKKSKIECALAATGHSRVGDYTYDSTTKQCSLYKHKPLFYQAKPGCSGYKARYRCLLRVLTSRSAIAERPRCRVG